VEFSCDSLLTCTRPVRERSSTPNPVPLAPSNCRSLKSPLSARAFSTSPHPSRAPPPCPRNKQQPTLTTKPPVLNLTLNPNPNPNPNPKP